MVFPGNARALPQAGRSRDYKEGPTSSALCGEGASPLPGPPGAMPTTVHCTGEVGNSPDPVQGFTRT